MNLKTSLNMEKIMIHSYLIEARREENSKHYSSLAQFSTVSQANQ